MSVHDPLTGARVSTGKIDPTNPRGGVPADKFGTVSVHLQTPERRQAVMLMLYPPEALRDQPLNVIEAAIAASAQSLLKTIALEIYKSYTSDPVDASGYQNIVTALQGHIDTMRGQR